MRGRSTIDLGITRVTHACRKERRGWGRIRSDGCTTRRVNKRKRRRVQEGGCVGRAGAAKDATALPAML